MSPDEQRGYAKGYSAGKRRKDRDKAADQVRATAAQERAASAMHLYETLVSGLQIKGLSLDTILDAQVAGMMADD
jgi:hypothetical protein